MKMMRVERERFLERLTELHLECVETSRKKNADYASGDDPFQNFRLIETLTQGRTSVEDGILVRMSDKLQRVANLLTREAEVEDESLLDALSDLSNYALILRIYAETKTRTSG